MASHLSGLIASVEPMQGTEALAVLPLQLVVTAIPQHQLLCSLEALLRLSEWREVSHQPFTTQLRKFALGTHIPKLHLQILQGKLFRKEFFLGEYTKLRFWTSHLEAGVRGVQEGRKPFSRVKFFQNVGKGGWWRS